MHLHAAAARGDVEGIAYALKRGTPVDALDRSKSTALTCAIQGTHRSKEVSPRSNVAAFRLLLDAGANINKLDSVGTPPLFRAAQAADPVFLEELLARGADPRQITKEGYTSLIYAVHQTPSPTKIAMMDRLFELGVDINQESKHGESPVSVCFRQNDFASLRHLLQLGASPGPLHWKDLHRAVAFGSLDEVRALAGSAGDINAKNRWFEVSPWLLALRVGDPAKIQSLAERGADLAQVGRLGDTGLHLAAEAGAEASVRWLLEYGADINAVNDFGDTPLHAAVKASRHAVAQLLLAAGADPGRQNSVQDKPVNAAVQAETVRLLIERVDADANAISGSGNGP